MIGLKKTMIEKNQENLQRRVGVVKLTEKRQAQQERHCRRVGQAVGSQGSIFTGHLDPRRGTRI